MSEAIGLQHPDGTMLVVGMLPGRKRPSLYRVEGNVITTLASFRDDDAAELAKDFIRRAFGSDKP